MHDSGEHSSAAVALGNTAARGIRESFGIMVNYLYDPDAIEANHELFVRNGVVARSAEVDALMPGIPAEDAKATGRKKKAKA